VLFRRLWSRSDQATLTPVELEVHVERTQRY
jgi:hypothetical protein